MTVSMMMDVARATVKSWQLHMGHDRFWELDVFRGVRL